jgi:hypothetical protein
MDFGAHTSQKNDGTPDNLAETHSHYQVLAMNAVDAS